MEDNFQTRKLIFLRIALIKIRRDRKWLTAADAYTVNKDSPLSLISASRGKLWNAPLVLEISIDNFFVKTAKGTQESRARCFSNLISEIKKGREYEMGEKRRTNPEKQLFTRCRISLCLKPTNMDCPEERKPFGHFIQSLLSILISIQLGIGTNFS